MSEEIWDWCLKVCSGLFKLLKNGCDRMKSFKVRYYSGISELGWKFLVVFLLYVFSFSFMGQDPMYGAFHFEWDQGLFALMISFCIVSVLVFEWKILGPTIGVNVFLSLFLMVPFSLFSGRIMGPSRLSEKDLSLLGTALEGVESLSKFIGLTQITPRWIQEIFTSPGAAILLIGICFALAVKKRTAQMGLLLGVLLVPFFIGFSCEPRYSGFFILGMLFMFSGMILQFMDMDKYHWSATLLEALEDVDDKAERGCCIKIMKYVRKHGQMTAGNLNMIVCRCYREKHKVVSDCNQIAFGLMKRLVDEHGLLVLQATKMEQVFVLNENTFDRKDKLAEIVRWPRNVILGVIAFLWILSPIDLIPDMLPFGVIDDAVIAYLGFSPFLRQVVTNIRGGGG